MFNKDGTFKGWTWITSNPDKTFVKTPGCILCDYQQGLGPEDLRGITDPAILGNLPNIRKLEKNKALRDVWLYVSGEHLGADAIALPSIGASTLYVKGEYGLWNFYEFALFTQEAASQGTGSPASGGQSEGRKTPNVERFNFPVGGANSTLSP